MLKRDAEAGTCPERYAKWATEADVLGEALRAVERLNTQVQKLQLENDALKVELREARGEQVQAAPLPACTTRTQCRTCAHNDHRAARANAGREMWCDLMWRGGAHAPAASVWRKAANGGNDHAKLPPEDATGCPGWQAIP